MSWNLAADAEYSAAKRRGLIEAIDCDLDDTILYEYSAAKRRGLIEAR